MIKQSEIQLCSGIGQYQKPPYSAVTLSTIRELVDQPQQTDKHTSRWLIPSTHSSRQFSDQSTNGQFHLLWFDGDEKPQTLEQVERALAVVCGDIQHEIYTSRSATINKQKCRILIPLSHPLTGYRWQLCQMVLNDKLQQLGIEPDRANERHAQLCYLPNRGEYYKAISNRVSKQFNPLDKWRTELNAKHQLIKEQSAQKKPKRTQQVKNIEGSLITVFNNTYSVEDILIQAGYEQKGSQLKHPNSQSGNYSASVKNNRVYTLSPNDLLYSDKAHDAFSAFTVLFHGGDARQAMIDAGNEWLFINGLPFNKAKQKAFYGASK